MTPSDLPEFFWQMPERPIVWIVRRIPIFQVPRPNGFISRAFRKIKFLGRNFNY